MKLYVRSKRGRVQPVRLTLGTDCEAALLAIQSAYCRMIARPVSRSVIVRRALLAHLDRVRTLDPEEHAAEATAVLRAAKA